MQALRTNRIICLLWVKDHSDVPENGAADDLAKKSAADVVAAEVISTLLQECRLNLTRSRWLELNSCETTKTIEL